jgi:MoaA/NifB/PqqE/SkfB family radical SAM enzyme
MPNEMTKEELSAIWPDIISLKPHKIIFTGGEPLLRCDIIDLLEELHEADADQSVIRCLNTNGHLMTNKLAINLVGLVDEVRVSIDAIPPYNDLVRDQGNFEAALRSLGYLYDAGFEPIILVTVTANTLPHLEDLLLFLNERGFKRIHLNQFRPIGRGSEHQDWSVDPTRIHEAMVRAWRRIYMEKATPFEFSESKMPNCGAGSFLNILPNGDVYPCHALMDRRFFCGNLREQSLIDICRHSGLLGQLSKITFDNLINEDNTLAPLLKRPSCMGTVYAVTKDSASWKRCIPDFTK